MQSSDSMKTITTIYGEIINYKEVPVPNTSYSKFLREDGRVAVVTSYDGGGWSSASECPPEYKRQFMLDSRIVLFVLSPKYKTRFDSKLFKDLMNSIFPTVNIPDDYHYRDFWNFERNDLEVHYVQEHTMFRIFSYWGQEFIDIPDPDNHYMPA